MAESLKDNITEFTVQQKREPNIKECAVQQLQKTESFSIELSMAIGQLINIYLLLYFLFVLYNCYKFALKNKQVIL